MKATLKQSNLHNPLGTNVAGVDDSSKQNCIFYVRDGSYRKMAAINKLTCQFIKAGYSGSATSGWNDMSIWVNNPAYSLDNLQGCVDRSSLEEGKITVFFFNSSGRGLKKKTGFQKKFF